MDVKDIEKALESDVEVTEKHCILQTRLSCWRCFCKVWPILRKALVVLLLAGYFVFLAFAIKHNFEYAKSMVAITPVVLAKLLYVFIRNNYGQQIYDVVCCPVKVWLVRYEYRLKCVLGTVVVVAMVLYLCVSVIQSARQLQSLAGLVICFLLPWITCKHPDKIQWRPVICGFVLQLVLGIIVLRWQAGYDAIKWLSNEISKFIFFALDGAAVVFGDPFFLLHPFLMVVVPLVVYMGAVMAVFYYIGLTQIVARKIGWLMSVTMETTAIESTSLAANIFLSVMDTVLMLRPYLDKLTLSELHTFLVGAHATIAGFAFGIFVLFGVSPHHLLTGAVMSAPAAVAIAKLNYPETQKSNFQKDTDFTLQKSSEHNVIEAFSNGAMVAGRGVIMILLQVIAFLATFQFLDITVAWLGSRVGLHISINTMLGYVFMPVAFILGVDWEDSQKVGQLIGLKVTANEFLSYIGLGWLNVNRIISRRSNAIATYALCGFSSLRTLAIFSGVWMTVSRDRWSTVTRLIPRIFLNAHLACFMTACVAGLFYSDGIENDSEPSPTSQIIARLIEVLPSFRDIANLLPN